MKLGGAPGTLLICGIALDCKRCAIKDTQYKLGSDSRIRDHVFLLGLLHTSCPVITLYIVTAGTLRHSPQIWLNPFVRPIIFAKELANLRVVSIQSQRSLPRCSKLSRPWVNNVLSLN